MQILGKKLDIEFPEFKPRFPWIGADLQTIRSSIFIEPGIKEDKRLIIPVDTDKDQAIAVALNNPKVQWNGKLLVVCHGLGGTEGSGYMRRTTQYFLDKGWKVARINLRGAGKSAETSIPPYHAGMTNDIRCVLAYVQKDNPEAAIYLMGLSLGGQLTLGMLIEGDVPIDLKAAVSVSAPIDMTMTSHVLSKPRNKIYVSHLVKQVKRDLRKCPALISEEELSKITLLRELDERIIAKYCNFKDRFHYYESVSVVSTMKKIKIPTLAIHAKDDPWIPYEAYCKAIDGDHDAVTVLLLKHGGHVGFFGKGSKINWFIPTAEQYFNHI